MATLLLLNTHTKDQATINIKLKMTIDTRETMVVFRRDQSNQVIIHTKNKRSDPKNNNNTNSNTSHQWIIKGDSKDLKKDWNVSKDNI